MRRAIFGVVEYFFVKRLLRMEHAPDARNSGCIGTAPLQNTARFAAHDLVLRIACEATKARVGVLGMALRIADQYSVIRFISHQRQQPYGLALGYHRRDVRRVLDHLVRATRNIVYGGVAGLYPHIVAVFMAATKLTRMVLPAAQHGPKLSVLRFFSVCWVHENSMVLPHHLFGAITHGLQEQRIGLEDGAVEIELDDCLRFINGLQLALTIDIVLFALRSVLGQLEHPLNTPGG